MAKETSQEIATEMVNETAKEVTDNVTEIAVRNNDVAFQTTKPRITRRHSYGK